MKFPIKFFSLFMVFFFNFLLPPSNRMGGLRFATYVDRPRSKCLNVCQMIKAFQAIVAVFVSGKMT